MIPRKAEICIESDASPQVEGVRAFSREGEISCGICVPRVEAQYFIAFGSFGSNLHPGS